MSRGSGSGPAGIRDTLDFRIRFESGRQSYRGLRRLQHGWLDDHEERLEGIEQALEQSNRGSL